MTGHSVGPWVLALAVVAVGDGQASGVQAGREAARAADLAAIEKLRKQDIAATLARDSVALTEFWTEDAMRLSIGTAEIGKAAIRATNDRLAANKDFKVLSYVPEIKDFTFLEGGWAVEWRAFTASYIDAPGGPAKQIRGTLLAVLKKLPDGSWKAFRAMGDTEAVPAGKAGGS